MIRLFLGNIGSGKTISAVREMAQNLDGLRTYTNIRPTHKMDNVTVIKPSMIMNREVVGEKRNGEPVVEYTLNKDYWESIKDPINVVLDEAHTLINARRFMSKQNEIMNNWLAMLRRVICDEEGRHGELTLITQLPRRVDVIAREMATNIRYHICHYYVRCIDCGMTYYETSESPEKVKYCSRCGRSRIKAFGHRIEVFHFKDMESYTGWKDFGMKTFHLHYMIPNVERYFPLYKTLQWENMFESY